MQQFDTEWPLTIADWGISTGDNLLDVMDGDCVMGGGTPATRENGDWRFSWWCD